MPTLPGDPAELVALLDAAVQALADAPLTSLDDAAVVDVMDRLEVVRRRTEVASARLLIEVSDRGAFRGAGYLSVHQFLAQGLRLGRDESLRRRVVARETGVLHNLQGEELPPRMPATTAGVADGAISSKQVEIIANILHKIPDAVAPTDKARAEKILADADLSPEAVQAAAGRDERTQSQRNHDALVAMLDYLLANRALGAPDRIPAELVITTTLGELEARAGTALTATGTRLPIGDLVAVAAHAVPWLEVFADARAAVLYFGRGKRLATKAQRLAMFGRDRGCTAPGCRRPFAQTQAHHVPPWKDGGLTNIDQLGAACGPHNVREGREPGQWESAVVTDGPHAGRIGWRPAGSANGVDSAGRWQVNPLHHPEMLLAGAQNAMAQNSVIQREHQGSAIHRAPAEDGPFIVASPITWRAIRRRPSALQRLLAGHPNHRPPVVLDGGIEKTRPLRD